MQVGVHLQLLVGAVRMERKMKSSVGLCLALEPEMETKVELTRLNRLDHQRICFFFPTGVCLSACSGSWSLAAGRGREEEGF